MGSYFKEAGRRSVCRDPFAPIAIGPEEQKWDEVFIAVSPSIDHFVGMLRNTGCRQKAVMHRQATVQDSPLVRLSPVEPAKFFQASWTR